MIIACKECQRQYHLLDDAVAEEHFLVKCSGCGAVFTAYKPARAEEIAFLNLPAAKQHRNGEKIIAVSNQKGGGGKNVNLSEFGRISRSNGEKSAVDRFGCTVQFVDITWF